MYMGICYLHVGKKERLVSSGRGICKICGESVDAKQVSRHIKKHVPADGKGTYYIIRVSSSKHFWMFLQVNGAATLKHLDSFLKDAWLECCGHLSAFTINEKSYEIMPSDSWAEKKPESMDHKISSVLEKGTSFSYEYDFGTTTALSLLVREANVPALTPSGPRPKPVQLLAIHDPVRFVCDKCGSDATLVCSYCRLYDFGGLGCDACMKEHSCCVSDGIEIALPVVQSPRVGQCGYEGPTISG